MAIRTDYTAGEPILATDTNEVNTQVLANMDGISGNTTLINANASLATGKSYHTDYLSGKVSIDTGRVLADYASTLIRITDLDGKTLETRNTTLDWASATAIGGIVILGEYAFVFLGGGTEGRIYRYTIGDINSGGTLCTHSFFGSNFLLGYTSFFHDGTDFFINCWAGAGIRYGDATSRFDISFPVAGTRRFTFDGVGTAPLFVTNGLQVGDNVRIFGGSPALNVANQGKVEIQTVTETYIEFHMDGGAIQNDVTAVTITTASPANITKMSLSGTTFTKISDFSLSVTLNGEGTTESFANLGEFLVSDGTHIYDLDRGGLTNNRFLKKYNMLGEPISAGSFSINSVTLLKIENKVYLGRVDTDGSVLMLIEAPV